MTLTQFVVGLLFGIVPLLVGIRMKDNPETAEEIGVSTIAGDWSETHSRLLAWFLIAVGVLDLFLFIVDISG